MARMIARVTDLHMCPALAAAGSGPTPIGAPGCLTFRVGGLPVARAGVDGAPCVVGRDFVLASPAIPPHLFAGGLPVVHALDPTSLGGRVLIGCIFAMG